MGADFNSMTTLQFFDHASDIVVFVVQVPFHNMLLEVPPSMNVRDNPPTAVFVTCGILQAKTPVLNIKSVAVLTIDWL